jgi:hypothetical protein
MRAPTVPKLSRSNSESVRSPLNPRPPATPTWQLLLPLALGLFSGCVSGSPQWVKPGYTQQHAIQQSAICQLTAERIRFSSEEPKEDRDARILHEVDLCMKGEGWMPGDVNSEQVSEQASQPGPRQASQQVEGHTS